MIGAEAMLRLFGEPEANERAFVALARFLDVLDTTPPGESRPALDALGLSFQLKLLWLAGYLPHLTSCVECGAADNLVGILAARRRCRLSGARGERRCGSRPKGSPASSAPVDAARRRDTGAGLSDRARRDALAVVTTSYEEHGGFRLRTVSA